MAAALAKGQYWRAMEKSRRWNSPSICGGFGGLRKLKLDAVNAIDTVNEQDQYEDKRDLSTKVRWAGSRRDKRTRYLDPILQFRHRRTFRDESQKRALPGKGHWDDERHEDDHLEDEKSEYLDWNGSAITVLRYEMGAPERAGMRVLNR